MRTLLSTGLAVCAAAAFLTGLPASPASADVATCHGLPVTIVAAQGTVTGTPGPDVIAVTGDGVVVDAGDGDDTICVDGIHDIVDAGAGNDVVDTTSAGHGQQFELIDLGPGSDRFTGGSTKDEVDAGAGLSSDQDVVSTGGGKDTVTVSSSRVDVATGPGHDFIDVAAGTLGGGSLSMGQDSDNDVLTVQRSDGTVDVDLRHQRLTVDDAPYTLKGANVATVTAPKARLKGDSHFNSFYVHSCNATLVGGGGPDRLTVLGPDQSSPALTCASAHGVARGGPGNDHLAAGDGGRFVLVGGAGSDRALGDGYTGAHTVCRAEVERGCVR